MSAPAHALVRTTGIGVPDRAMAGFGTALALAWRRNRLRLGAWLLSLVGMYAYIAAYYADTFTTARALEDYAALSATPGMKAITGLSKAADTLGGAVWTKGWMTIALSLAIGSVFLITRSGRADEESGRSELLRVGALGIRACSHANALLVALLAGAVGIGLSAVSLLQDLDPAGTGISGSLVLGASTSGIGLIGLGVGALAGQLARTSRGANALGSATIIAFYGLRMIGDLGPEWLTWFSPIGWGVRMQPYADNDWAPFALMLALAAVLLLLARRIESRRDLGTGLLPERLGRAGAPAFLASPLGLGLRLQGNAILGWTLAIGLSGLLFGSVVESMTSLLDNTGGNVDALLRGSGVTALVSLLVLMMGLLTMIFALQSALTLRGDEAGGILEAQFAGALSRRRWALERLLIPACGSALLLLLGGGLLGAVYGASISDASQAGALALAALAYWPAVMVYVGIVLVLWAFLPRLAVPISWSMVAATCFLTMFGEVFSLPRELLDALPLAATPYMPMESFDPLPLLGLAAAALLLLIIGVEGFARRDLTGA